MIKNGFKAIDFPTINGNADAICITILKLYAINANINKNLEIEFQFNCGSTCFVIFIKKNNEINCKIEATKPTTLNTKETSVHNTDNAYAGKQAIFK